MINFYSHFPECWPANKTIKTLIKQKKHIFKMWKLRDEETAKLRAIDKAAKLGLCYCDKEYNCGCNNSGTKSKADIIKFKQEELVMILENENLFRKILWPELMEAQLGNL